MGLLLSANLNIIKNLISKKSEGVRIAFVPRCGRRDGYGGVSGRQLPLPVACEGINQDIGAHLQGFFPHGGGVVVHFGVGPSVG